MTLGGVEIPVADPLATAWFDMSDLGNARRLERLAGNKLRWVEDIGAWAHYDGRKWSLERGDIEAQRLAHKVVEYIDDEVNALAAIADKPAEVAALWPWCTTETALKRVSDLRAHSVKTGSASMTNGMLKQAQALLTALFADFDPDPYAYNCLNGTLRFVRGEDRKWGVKFGAHDPADMLMKVANVIYQEGAGCPFWEQRILDLQPDEIQQEAMQRLYGYTLTGLTSDQAFYVHQGKGGDGKSATHMALADLHGDYYRHAGVKTFLDGAAGRGGAEHRSDLVRLAGDVRFVTCDEPKSKAVWDGECIKQITGSLITARGSGAKTEITYRPRFKLHVECNIVPKAPSADKGFRRRFKLYQWQVGLPEAGQVGYIPLDEVLNRLAEEKSGILNWMIAGCLRWLETRVIPQSKAMGDVLKDFWADSDPLGEWMSEWCDLSNRDAVAAFKDLHDNYKKWCEDNGVEHPMTANAFGRALRDKQLPMFKDGRGVRWRKGIRLREEGFFGDDAPPVPVPSPARSASSATGPNPASDDDGIDPELIRP